MVATIGSQKCVLSKGSLIPNAKLLDPNQIKQEVSQFISNKSSFLGLLKSFRFKILGIL